VAENDLDSVVKGGTSTDQKRTGAAVQHIVSLRKEMQQLIDQGGATPELFEDTLATILRAFEVERVDQERQIRDYERKIEFCRATQRAASQYSSLIVGILMTKSRESRLPKTEVAPIKNGERISDKEMLQRICACGCVDAEDEANCDCVCHQGGYCDNPNCVTCPARRLEDEAGKTDGKLAEVKPVTKKRSTRKPGKKSTRKKK